MTQNKRNKSLIIAITLPIVMTLLLIVSVYLPGLFIKAQGDFMYISPGEINSLQQYKVVNSQLVQFKNKQSKKYYARNNSKIFIYNSAQDRSKEISYKQAQKIMLDENITSPKGFKVTCKGNNHGFFGAFFGGSSCRSRYLSGHNLNKKLNLKLNSNSSYYGFKFLGWVENNEE